MAAPSREALGDELRRLVIERSHDLITLLEPNGTITYASQSWLPMLGWDPEDVVGTSLLDYCHPDDLGRAHAAIGALADGMELPSVTTRRRTKDGRWLTIESNAMPVFDADGNVTAILGSAREVTEREELRLRVSELNALYRVAEAVATRTTIDALFDEALEALLSATAATRASLLLYDDAGVMRFRAWRGLSDAYRVATEGHSPWTPHALDPTPVLVSDIAHADFPPELDATLRQEGIAALAFVPIVHAGRLLGKFMLYADAPHAWAEREIRLCLTIANHLGSATVRTQTAAALRSQREQLEMIMRTVDEGIVVQSTSGRLIYANEAATRFVGYASPDQLLESDRAETFSRFEILADDGTPLPLDELPGRRALRGESSERLIRYRVRETGEERWSLVRADPVFDDDGKVTMSVSVIHDVTASRAGAERMAFLSRASELLNETLQVEQTLGTLADLAVPAFAGHVTVDLLQEDGGTRCVGARHLNPEKTQLMWDLRVKYPPTVEDHPVQRALRTGAPQFVPDVQAEAETMSHDEEHAAAIRELANTSGIVIPLIARGRTFGSITFGRVSPQMPFTDSDLELAVELGRRASAALDNALLYQEVEARAHAAEALEFVDDGVFLVDRDGVIRLWNAAAAKTFRVRATKALGRRLDEVVRDWRTLAERVTPASEPAAGSGTTETLPVEVHGTERWLSISAVSIPRGTVYAFRDLTEERAVEQLKSDFVSTVSHELRTPLAAIYGAALTLQRDDVRLEDSQRTGLLDVIASEADRLARIVNDILWASRLDSGQMGVTIESCDAAKLAHQVVDALGHHAPSAVALRVDAPAELPPVAADPDKLRQVLTNLVDNAVKYSPDGGTVTVTVATTGNRIRFRVDDEGLGVPPAEQGRIFEKFFRLDPQLTRGVGGTGLGLYICRELVQRMHGRIWVSSDGRRGSTFTVELPVSG